MYDILVEKNKLIQETIMLLQTIACSKIKRQFKSRNGSMTASFFIDKDSDGCPKLIDNLNHLYHDCGIGFKLLGKELNISYTRLRTVFKALGIAQRVGSSCVTENLKEIRSKNAKKPSNPWKDWTGKNPDKDKHHKHHLGGWYFNKSSSRYVWLRSSWEYAYASWLDSQNVSWDVEVRSYLLSDGRYYRPDFFIFVNNCLDHIVEIKSKWANGSLDRIDKFAQFGNEYSDIRTKLITNELFDIVGMSAADVLAEWKKTRILELKNE